MTDKTGGPAFPQSKGVGDVWVSKGGMSMRDYFAAKAMQGWVASGRRGGAEELARQCYVVADAMLKEREGGE